MLCILCQTGSAHTGLDQVILQSMNRTFISQVSEDHCNPKEDTGTKTAAKARRPSKVGVRSETEEAKQERKAPRLVFSDTAPWVPTSSLGFSFILNKLGLGPLSPASVSGDQRRKESAVPLPLGRALQIPTTGSHSVLILKAHFALFP